MPRGRRDARKGGRKAKQSLFEKFADAERFGFRWIGKALFVLVLLGIIFMGMASNILLVSAIAGVMLFIWVSVVFPVDLFRSFGEYLWSGDAGEDVHSWWCNINPFRDKRGTMTAVEFTYLFLALFVFGLAIGGLLFVAGVAAAEEQDCSTKVVYDDFNDDKQLIQEINKTGKGDKIRKNTRVTVEDESGFYRVRTENPNSYCVEVVVRISEELVPPADLGTVDSINGDAEARWVDIHDFESQTAYTEVRFTAPANSEIAFAPSKPTVLAPAWRDKHKRDAEGYLDRIGQWDPLGDESVEKRQYTIEVDDSRYATIPLVNLENEEERIEDYYLVYRVDSDEPWKPVTQSTADPVYYEEIDDGDRLRLVFNDRDAEVEFTANPSTRDTVTNEVRSLKRSFYDFGSMLPFAISPAGSLMSVSVSEVPT